ncbi:7 transmembrane receptor (Secretin family) [Popillia japonica]
MDIIRVICFQRSSSRLNPKQTRDVAKAILVLIPLFGLPLLLTSQRSLMNQNSCLSGDIYYFTAYTVEALQGIVVALLFCYLHREVHNEIVKKYRKWIIEINSRFGTDFKVPTQARVTTMTNVRPSGLDTTKYPQYPNTTPTYPNSYPKRGSPTEKR